MKKILYLVFAFIVLIINFSFSQTGTVRGTVIDDTTGEMIMFSTVAVVETSGGTETDLDGAFSIDLEPGSYTFIITYVGYADYKISNVEVKESEVNNLGTLRMLEETLTVEGEIVIEAKAIRNSDNALLTLQRKSSNVVDAISSQSFSRIGDSDAGAAIKRVTGVSIEDGKHVYVRGLGDRYTKTLLNGMTIPGLDPDKNSVQMDIFPTNLLDNIMVYKTFTPDLPGDFTGGTVDISLKDFPEEETFNISVSLGYNPSMHFKNDFLTYKGGKLDGLGFDDGTRALPFNEATNIPSEVIARDNEALAGQLNSITKSFNPQMAAETTTNFLNHGYSLSYGNQKRLDKFTIGYTVAANYSASSEHYDDAVNNQYIKNDFSSGTTLEVARADNQAFSDQNVLWSALASLSLKVKSNKFKLGVFRSQNNTSRTSLVTTFNGDENPAVLEKNNLEYIQRSVTNFFLAGEHKFGEGNLGLDWTVAPTFSGIDEPDNRYTAYEFVPETGQYLMSPSVGGEVVRVFRDLQEMNISTRLDMTYKFKKNKENKLKFGLSNTYKDRDYGILDYSVVFNGSRTLSGNPDEFLADENVWNYGNTLGTSFIRGDFQPANTYAARQNTNAAYIMNELPVGKIKFIYGLRVEQFTNWYTGQNALGNIEYDDEKVLDTWDILPSANLVYNIVEGKMNLRASYSRTVARPSFREVSVAQIQDRLSGLSFYGNIDIKTSDINNIDLRWEYFMKKGEVLSISPFVKLFKNPIELNAYQEGSFYRSDIVTPDNGGDAILYGVEFEFRKKLDFISSKLSGLTLGTNLSYVKSQVKMDDDELVIREAWARDGETIDDTRPLAGQAPFIVNTYLNYSSKNSKTEANLSYNVQGKRLMVIGLGEVPDLFEQPFHSLNFKISQKLGSNEKWKGSLSVQNILNQDRKTFYESFGTDDTTARLTQPGVAFSVSVAYKIL